MNLVELFNKTKKIQDIKNSMTGKKGVIFLCGQNLEEYNINDNFEKLLKREDVISLAYKNSSNILPVEPDILFLDTRIKDTKIPSSKVLIAYCDDGTSTPYNKIRRNEDFSPHIMINCIQKHANSSGINYIGYNKNINYEFGTTIKNNIMYNQKTTDNYSQSIMLMHYLGIKEIYIFGAYNIAHPDVRNNRFSHHFYNKNKKGGYVIETGHMMHALSSHWWYKYLLKRGVKVYNVSNEGGLCKKIPRISYTDMFKNVETIENTVVDSADCKEDCCLFSFIENRLDVNFYAKEFKTPPIFDHCLNHYIWKGYFCGCKLNNNDDHSMVNMAKPLRDVIIHKKYDKDIIFLYLLFKYPKLGMQLKQNPEFAFQNHVLSPIIYGKSQKITLPLTYSDCDKYIEESNFNYDNYYLQTFKDDKIFGYHPYWKCEFKVFKAHLTHIEKKYISLISHIIDKHTLSLV